MTREYSQYSHFFLQTEKPAHGKLSEYTTVNDYITYVPNPGHEGADFFTYHMALGSLHTNPVTVAITVSTSEEAERMGTSLSQVPSSSGFMSTRYSNGQNEDLGGGGGGNLPEGQHGSYFDEEAGSVAPPPQAPQYATSTPPGGFNRKSSYKDGTAAPSNLSHTAPAASSASAGVAYSRANTNSPTKDSPRAVEMSTMNSSGANNRDAGASLRRPPSVSIGEDQARRLLIPGGEVSSGEKKPRHGNTNLESSASRRK